MSRRLSTVFFLLIVFFLLGGTPHLVFASSYVYETSNVGIDSTGNITYKIGGAGNGSDFWLGSTPDFNHLQGGVACDSTSGSICNSIQNLVTGNSLSLPYTGYFCADGEGSYPSPCTQWVPVYVTASSFIPGLLTAFYSTTPLNGAVVASSSVFSWGVTGFLASSDAPVSLSMQLKENTQFGCAISVVSTASDCIQPFTFSVSSVPIGSFSYSTTSSVLNSGNYTLTASLSKPWFSFLGINIGSNSIVSTTTTFTIGSPTAFDTLLNRFASSTAILNNASSTIDFSVCNPFSWVFASPNFQLCFTALFVPSSYNLQSDISILQGDVIDVAPLGYVSRLYSDLASSTATSSLPVFHAIIPPGIPGTGAAITLDPNHSLDWILYASSTQFGNSATSTIYSLTSPLWDTFVYILALYYIIRRVLGKGLLPDSLFGNGYAEGAELYGDIIKAKGRADKKKYYDEVNKIAGNPRRKIKRIDFE